MLSFKHQLVLSSFFFLAIFVFSPLFGDEIPEKPIVVVIPSYNNVNWYEKNLNSIFMQDYSNYRIIYLNDCSKDNTGQAVENYLKEYGFDYRVIEFDDSIATSIPEAAHLIENIINQESHFFTLINNKNRCGGLANLYRPILSCQDHEIIVTVDGDDWLHHPQVFNQLNKLYSENTVLLTHGRYQEYPSGNSFWSQEIPPLIIARNNFREFRCPTHLRTFYAWLFKKIMLEDLLYEGRFLWMTWDMAMMFPMIEMAGERHAFINEVNYIYNTANQINDHKVDRELQLKLENFIRNKQHYKRLRKQDLPTFATGQRQ